ncbi:MULTISPECIES: hypothetical protein [unclassified Mesorhizobium]|uniref:hypothetical protein n=1 Tax=unclassified Mesorhizobium TaxID=325217 RepID=UPI00143F5C3B|nr:MULTISPECIES: hypothetical protein [unclassified Mesorhizobium]
MRDMQLKLPEDRLRVRKWSDQSRELQGDAAPSQRQPLPLSPACPLSSSISIAATGTETPRLPLKAMVLFQISGQPR